MYRRHLLSALEKLAQPNDGCAAFHCLIAAVAVVCTDADVGDGAAIVDVAAEAELLRAVTAVLIAVLAAIARAH